MTNKMVNNVHSTVWPSSRVLALALCLCAAAQAQEKYAVLTGINDYPAPISALHGCVNDMLNLQGALTERFGFPARNIVLLRNAEAKRADILSQLEAASGKVRRGDVFVFGYSGHGTVFPDERSEELDETAVITPKNRQPGKYDAALVPVDVRANNSGKPWGNLILDDELFTLFKKFTDKGCLVVVISDSCHSGTLGRTTHRAKAVSTEDALGIPYNQIRNASQSRSVGRRDLGGLYLTLTSSTDEQVSIEWTDDNNRECGLFTYAFLKALSRGGATYQQVYEAARREVLQLSEQGQEPQVDTRFYAGKLDAPLFSAPVASNPGNPGTPVGGSPIPGKLRIVVRVQSEDGQPVANSAFVVYRPGVQPAQGQIKREDALLLGRTNDKGLFDSGSQSVYLEPGTYRLKVVCVGYRTFEGDRVVIENGGQGLSVLTFKLVRE